jgi:hypothetical protein
MRWAPPRILLNEYQGFLYGIKKPESEVNHATPWINAALLPSMLVCPHGVDRQKLLSIWQKLSQTAHITMCKWHFFRVDVFCSNLNTIPIIRLTDVGHVEPGYLRQITRAGFEFPFESVWVNVRNLREINRLEGPGVDGLIILKRISRK